MSHCDFQLKMIEQVIFSLAIDIRHYELSYMLITTHDALQANMNVLIYRIIKVLSKTLILISYLVPDGLSYFLPLCLHAGVFGFPLLLLLPQRLLPLLFLLGCVWVLLLLSSQHLTHVFSGPWEQKSHIQ